MHTPAPWHNDGYRIYGPTNEPDKRSGKMIVEYKHVDYFNWDDADLIRAAPEMFDVLKKLVGMIPNSVEFNDWPELQEAHSEAEALLAQCNTRNYLSEEDAEQ